MSDQELLEEIYKYSACAPETVKRGFDRLPSVAKENLSPKQLAYHIDMMSYRFLDEMMLENPDIIPTSDLNETHQESRPEPFRKAGEELGGLMFNLAHSVRLLTARLQRLEARFDKIVKDSVR